MTSEAAFVVPTQKTQRGTKGASSLPNPPPGATSSLSRAILIYLFIYTYLFFLQRLLLIGRSSFPCYVKCRNHVHALFLSEHRALWGHLGKVHGERE